MGRRVLRRHIWGYSVCLCPTKGTPGFNELNTDPFKAAYLHLFLYFRGLMARSIIQAQAASPTFTHVYAALVAIVNTKVSVNLPHKLNITM